METIMEGTKPRATRRRLSEQAWKVVMMRFDGAAMTIQAFCAREGLSPSSFRLWRSRLISKAEPASSGVRPSPKAVTPAPAPAFVDLGLLGASSARDHGALDLRIDLGGGLSLHLVRR
jgi:hypothetical protein